MWLGGGSLVDFLFKSKQDGDEWRRVNARLSKKDRGARQMLCTKRSNVYLYWKDIRWKDTRWKDIRWKDVDIGKE